MKHSLLATVFFLAITFSVYAQTPGTVTTITSVVLLDSNQIPALITQAAPTLPSPTITQASGVITITSTRVMTSAEITAFKSACQAALFKVTTN